MDIKIVQWVIEIVFWWT